MLGTPRTLLMTIAAALVACRGAARPTPRAELPATVAGQTVLDVRRRRAPRRQLG